MGSPSNDEGDNDSLNDRAVSSSETSSTFAAVPKLKMKRQLSETDNKVEKARFPRNKRKRIASQMKSSLEFEKGKPKKSPLN